MKLGSSTRYALLAAAIFIGIKLLTFFTHSEFTGIGAYSRLISLGLMAIPIYLGIRDKRGNELGGFITLRQVMIAGVIIALQAAIIASVYTFIHYTYIDTEFITNIVTEVKHQGELQHKSASDIENKIAEVTAFYSPFKQTTAALWGILVAGALLSFILSSFLVRKPEEQT